jgi:arylsulfatase A-like enzyme
VGARIAGLALLALLAAATLIIAPWSSAASSDGRPNIVMIITDDQTLSEMAGLPQTRNLIGGAGVTFSRFYISYPLCCPSRATFLTGRYSHNHGVHGNTPPNGGAGVFNDAQTVPVWLHNSGYKTVHIGKYLNGYALTSGPFVPPGWDEWYGKLGRTNGVASENHYFDYSMYEQGPTGLPQLINYGEAQSDYQTDIYRDKAVDAINRLSGPGASQPFYLSLDFGAPHFPYTPAPRHEGALTGVPLPKLAAFNERNLRDKPKFMRVGTRGIPQKTRRRIANRRRLRLEQLLSVDEAISSVFDALTRTGELSNTYVLFASDNGYFNGEHRVYKGKYLPQEPSSHVPMMMRGPGLPAGATSAELSANVDIAPTIIAAAGPAAQAQVPAGFVDGRSLLPFAANPAATTQRPVLLEADRGTLEGDEPTGDTEVQPASLSSLRGVPNLEQEPFAHMTKTSHNSLTSVSAPAYRAIRTNRYLFVQYASGAQELYDMLRDPAQVHSVNATPAYRAVKAFLAAQLLKLEVCHGTACDDAIPPDPAPIGGATSRLTDGGGGGRKKPKAGSGKPKAGSKK